MTINSVEAGKILGIGKGQVASRARRGLLPYTNKLKLGAKRIVWAFDKETIERIAHGEQPIEKRVEKTLLTPLPPLPKRKYSKKNGESRLERIEAKLDRLLKILE